MKWNLRMVAAQRDIWRPTELRKAFEQVGFTPSLSKVASLWSHRPVSVRLDDLDHICAALSCTVADLLQAESLAERPSDYEETHRAVGQNPDASGPIAHRRRSPSRVASTRVVCDRPGDGRVEV